MLYKNEDNTIFSQEFKRQVSENIHFLIKVICNILCIITIQILEIIFFFLKKLFKPNFFALQSKIPKNASKKLVKLNNDLLD